MKHRHPIDRIDRKLDAGRAGHTPVPRRLITGFTLTELMVVVSILIILIAAAALTSMQVLSSGAEQQTRITLAAAKSIAREYRLHTGQNINHSSPPRPPDALFDWGFTVRHDPPNDQDASDVVNDRELQGDQEGATSSAGRFQHASSERFVWVTYQLPATRDMLKKLGKQVLTDDNNNGYLELRDGWGNKIVYVERVENSSGIVAFLPEHPRPFFASAGRDGEWGTNINDPRAADNLYSFNID